MNGDFTGEFSSNITFVSAVGKLIFIIDKEGCHVPDGITVDEASQGVIDALDEHIQNLIKPLKKENAELKSKIAGGIRVYAHQEFDDAWWCNINVPYFNATLLLDKGE